MERRADITPSAVLFFRHDAFFAAVLSQSAADLA